MFDQYDIEIRPNARKEKELRVEGRVKVVDIKEKYLNKAPLWSKE